MTELCLFVLRDYFYDCDGGYGHDPHGALLRRLRDVLLRVRRVLPTLHKIHTHDHDDDDHVHDHHVYGDHALLRGLRVHHGDVPPHAHHDVRPQIPVY